MQMEEGARQTRLEALLAKVCELQEQGLISKDDADAMSDRLMDMEEVATVQAQEAAVKAHAALVHAREMQQRADGVLSHATKAVRVPPNNGALVRQLKRQLLSSGKASHDS